jgi:hypothetical protein
MANNLKCDADGCLHREHVEEYGPHLIDKPCPICGANLLTQEDFDGYEPIRVVIQALIDAGHASWSGEEIKSPVSFSLNHHAGTTTTTIKTKEV